MTNWNVNFGALLSWHASANAQPVAPAAPTAPQTTLASVDLGALGVGPIGHGSQAEQVFGCRCSTNPSGMSPQEIAAAQAENARLGIPST